MPEFMKAADLKAAGVTYSPAYLKRLEAKGEFPKRVQFGPKKSLWVKADVERYVADKIAASRT